MASGQPVAIYRETGSLGVVIGAMRNDNPAEQLSEAFADRLYQRFNAS